jgi:DnaJ family protein A protein 2
MGGFPGGNIHVFTSGGPGGGFPRGLQKPAPTMKQISITMEQVLNGGTVPIDIERWIISGGNKTTEHETMYIDLPKGIDENEMILIKDKGNIIDEDNKGDVKVVIKIENDSSFQRNGLDLLFNKSISLKDALCGFTFELKYINGKLYTLNCNSGNVICPGYKKIVPNMGLTRDNHTGNLIIQFHVDFPEKCTEEQITQLKEIL